MANLFLILSFLCLLMFLLGAINPKLVLLWGKEKTRKKVGIYFGIPFFVFIVLLAISIPSNEQENKNMDELTYIKNYADEIIPAILLGLASFDLYVAAWSEDWPYETGLQNIKDNAYNIIKVNEQYWTNDFPNIEEVKKWSIIRGRGDPVREEWEIEGQELAEALLDIKDTSTGFARVLHEAYRAGENWVDQLTVSQVSYRKNVEKSLERLNWLLYREE